MDMKRILQAMDGVATKPVAGANDMAKFLSIVDKNASMQILNEGKSPHAVSLPVQMAMQHYQKQESKPRVTVSTTNGLGKYFHDVEQEFQENQTSKRQLINQYAGKIAERVLMKEGKQDPLEKIAKRKALQAIDSSLYKNYSEDLVNEKSTSEKQARTMAAAAHDPEFAKKLGIKQSVAKEFNKKDKGTKLLSNAMKHKKVKENEIPGHSMGFKPGPGGPGLMPNEAQDPNFTGFMNRALGTRQDKKPLRVDPNTIMSMNNMPGYKHAFKFGMDIIKKMDPDTKQHFANEDDDALESYMIDIAEKKGLIPKYFVEEDLSEVVGEFEEIFHDPEMEGWSWADLLRDMIGQEPMAHEKANVQAHKQMMAKAQAEKDNPPPIDPNKLKVVDRTDTGQSEIWYPSGGFFGTNSWVVVQGGFKDKAHAEHTLHQLKVNPNVVNIIKKAIADEDDQMNESPLDFDKNDPSNSMIYGHKSNPGTIEYRIMRARGQLKDLAERAQTNDLLTWEHIARQFPELAMNIEEIRHGIEELAKIRKGGGRRVHNIPKDIGESNPIKEANAKKRTLKNSNPCWRGYHPVGTKKKNGRTVPNCVPKE